MRLMKMPVVYRCKSCGRVIFAFKRVGQDYFGVPTPGELASRLGGRCPFCGKPLNLRPGLEDIRISTKVVG